MDPKFVTPLLLAAVVVFFVYRRVRRNFGRQLVSERRLKFRVIVLALVGALILIGSLQHPLVLGALAGGVAAGIGLAMIGLHHTKFEASSEGRFYIPHTYTGLLVTALFWVACATGWSWSISRHRLRHRRTKTRLRLCNATHSRCSCLRC